MGISQLELSHRSSISQASIARIESDQQRNLKAETIRKLADSLGVSVSRLIEEPSIIKEEITSYVTPKMLPVIKWSKFKDLKSKRVPILSDLVLFLSHELTTLGRIYCYPRMTILLPLSKESPPHVLKKEDVRRPGVRILRVSEIRKKY